MLLLHSYVDLFGIRSFDIAKPYRTLRAPTPYDHKYLLHYHRIIAVGGTFGDWFKAKPFIRVRMPIHSGEDTPWPQGTTVDHVSRPGWRSHRAQLYPSFGLSPLDFEERCSFSSTPGARVLRIATSLQSASHRKTRCCKCHGEKGKNWTPDDSNGENRKSTNFMLHREMKRCSSKRACQRS